MIGGRFDGDAVGEGDAGDEHGQDVFTLQAPPGFRGGDDELEDHEPGGLLGQGALGSHRPVPDRREDAFDGVRGAQMVPVLGREVEEGQERLAVLGQAFGGLGVFGTVGNLVRGS